MQQIVRLFLFGLAVLCGAGPTVAQQALPILAEVGPWPVASRLIAYDGRLWFANSVKGRNHNSADLYSYDPASGETRYERHLFSQDAGRPLVYDGLLYWPYEDPRVSLSWGHVDVTDGERWVGRTIPGAKMYHAHALAELDGQLVAATSAWRAGLQISDDGGWNWVELYDHPTPEGKVSRITDLWPLNDKIIASLSSRDDAGAYFVQDGWVLPLSGWPDGGRPHAGTVFDGWFYGLVGRGDEAALWRSDGHSSEEITPTEQMGGLQALASDGEALWLLTRQAGGGRVWRSPDGRDWQARFTVRGGVPWELLMAEGWPFVAGAGLGGTGILWGPVPGSLSLPRQADKGTQARPASGAGNWELARVQLQETWQDPASYQSHAAGLRDLIYRIALAQPPAGFFESFLDGPWPDVEMDYIGGAVTVQTGKIGRWVLLWGLALTGEGRVPLEYLTVPWDQPENRAEKYFETLPAALWTVAQLGQNDRETIDALIARLDFEDDPLWLTGDVIGALTAATGERFGYDKAAWRDWWQGARASW